MHNIESRLTTIINKPSHDEFIFDFLLAYDVPKSNIDRVRKGELNKLEQTGEFVLRKKVHFKYTDTDLYATIDSIKKNLLHNKSKPRFVVVTNFDTFLAFDSKFGDPLDIEFAKLDKHYDFFLPLAGVEKQQFQNENIADVKAANNLAKLFDEIVKDNDHTTTSQRHALNIFLSRLLFCFFAEDTGIFTSTQFTNSLASHTNVDGSDTHTYLKKLFEIFNIEIRDDSFVEYLRSFPYVNGKLFQDTYDIPKFTTKSRKLLIELGQLDRSGINPDIFGSMMQAVMDSEERANMGSHYTSVPNIMKAIQPLFLDSLYEAFEECNGNQKKLVELLTRISKIKFFDPACGSGNFLIITYKEIRRLEIEIFKELGAGGLLTKSMISLSQFYGIELNDFAHETAKLSLYLAEHQMNVEFEREVGISTVSLPLRLGGNIVCGNACRIDREEVCPKNEGDEIYIMGNPPYLGARLQDAIQKEDMNIVFGSLKGANNLDYIACWFFKGAKYIRNHNAKYAFVTTNSLNQGEQVALLWPHIFDLGLEIEFGYSSFKWNNNAKGNAKVIVVIIGLRNISKDKKHLYKDNHKQDVENINAYLVNGSNRIILKRTKPLSDFPEINYGSFALDDGNFTLTETEKDFILKEDANNYQFIKAFIGSQELIRGIQRYCIWIEDSKKESIKFGDIQNRINKVKEWREKSNRTNTQKLSLTPWRFAEIRQPNMNYFAFPTISSEKRRYIPVDYINKDKIASNQLYVIPTNDFYIFGVISSYLHNIWIQSVAGRIKMDYRYSSTICYNTFPFPYITKKQKEEIEGYVYAVLDEREKHSEKTLAQMYDPDKMPEGLRQAHHELDLAIERCYRPKPFESDEERLEYLFKLYERMIAKEKEDNK